MPLNNPIAQAGGTASSPEVKTTQGTNTKGTR